MTDKPPYASILQGIAERNSGLTDQERGHLMDLSRRLQADPDMPEFEKWAGRQKLDLRKGKSYDYYIDAETDLACEAWRAAWSAK